MMILSARLSRRRYPRSEMANVRDSNIVVNEFEPQLHFKFTFRQMPLGNSMNPLIPHSYGLNSTTAVLLQE